MENDTIKCEFNEGNSEKKNYVLWGFVGVLVSTTPSILISLNCSSRSFNAAYLSADGVELIDELELKVLEEDNELTEPTDIGRP